jgi:hypothetical protein
MSTTLTKKIYLEIEVEVTGDYTKGSPGTFYRSNGDPGDPPEPEMFEIKNVIWNGLDITEQLDEDNFDFSSLEDECIEELSDGIDEYFKEEG